MARYFKDILFFGTITEAWKQDSNGEPFWSVDYDDGDDEDLNLTDVTEAILLFQGQFNPPHKPPIKHPPSKPPPQPDPPLTQTKRNPIFINRGATFTDRGEQNPSTRARTYLARLGIVMFTTAAILRPLSTGPYIPPFL